MKQLFAFLLLIPALSFAEAPDSQLPSRLKVLKHTSWYQDQAVYWKRLIDQSPEDIELWYNYYFSLTYANAPQKVRHEIAGKVLDKWPDNYYSMIIAARDKGYAADGLAYYRQVQLLKPLHPEVLTIGMLRSMVDGSAVERQQLATHLYEQKLISPSLYNYAYNLLMSVETNGVLFIESENTGIPLAVVQDVLQVRQDVTIVNVSLLEEANYREVVWKQLASAPTTTTSGTMEIEDILSLYPRFFPDKAFYYSLTLPRETLNELRTSLNLSGLALKYLKDDQNSSGELARNVSNFMMDYLLVDFNNEGDGAAGRVLEPNYLPGFIILKQHFEKTGNTTGFQQMEQLISRISSHSGLTKKIEKILSTAEATPVNFAKATIPIRQIEKQMKEVKAPLYAAASEVTNAAYNRFLNYLEQNGYSEEYEVAKIDLSNFEGVALSSMKSYFYVKPDTKKDDGYKQYPIINISYEAATLYCEWLTQQYNQQERRKYEEVRFRLPTLKEWQIAALGYKDFQSWNYSENTIKADFPTDPGKNKWEQRSYDLKDITVSYPWYTHDFTFRNAITNQHDCYLANILDSNCDCPANRKGDGFTMTSPVESYFSNGMGLFDVVGNVAEMVQEKGKAAGGSWAHLPEASTITSVSSYQDADAKVGFRVFMEVIKE